MNDLNEYLRKHLLEFRGGCLRIFGDWFGRPHDNIHVPKRFSFVDDILAVTFDNDETLTVCNPSSVRITDRIFKIEGASKVRWEWFYYGRPKTEENRFFVEYVKDRDGIRTDTNVNWYKPLFNTSMKEPAVIIE